MKLMYFTTKLSFVDVLHMPFCGHYFLVILSCTSPHSLVSICRLLLPTISHFLYSISGLILHSVVSSSFYFLFLFLFLFLYFLFFIFIFMNTKYFNTHIDGRENLKETDSGEYPKRK